MSPEPIGQTCCRQAHGMVTRGQGWGLNERASRWVEHDAGEGQKTENFDSTENLPEGRHRWLFSGRPAASGAQGAHIQVQGGNRAAERVSVHFQSSRRLALIAVVLAQYGRDEGFPELPNRFGVENPTLVYLTYECVEFASHDPRSFKRDERTRTKLRLLRKLVNSTNDVQPELRFHGRPELWGFPQLH